MLSAVAAMYGRDSKEYVMAGGTPHRRSKRAKTAATKALQSEVPHADPSSDPSPTTAAVETTGLRAIANGAAQNSAVAIGPH